MAKFIRWILLIFGVILAFGMIAGYIYLSKEWNRTTFFEDTTINGFDVAGKTSAEILPVISEAYSSMTVELTENGNREALWTLDDLGYTVDESSLLASIDDALSRQKSSIPVLLDSLANGNTFSIEVKFLLDADALSSSVRVDNLNDSRILNVNAEMVYDEESKTYSIMPEVQGTELNDADLQHLVQSTVEEAISGSSPSPDISIDIPSSLYIVPQVLSSDTELNNVMNVYNSYDKAVITYTFGSEKETIDWGTIKDWVIIEEGVGMLSEEKLREYVMNIGMKYNTKYYPRTFNTTLGTSVTFEEYENNYGYLVDEEADYQQLLTDITSNTEVEREPVYIDGATGLGRDGTDDLAGTYVEVSLSSQHLWFYKDYSLVIECDIVSGCVAKNTLTQQGVYPIAYKESPATLIPSNETNGTAVQYWMPFNDGQGLHDASWRASFGGTIYLTNGSHGCVNMPYYAADTVFNNIDTGTAVVLYY